MKPVLLVPLAFLLIAVPPATAQHRPEGAVCTVTESWPPSSARCAAAGLAAECAPVLTTGPAPGSCTAGGSYLRKCPSLLQGGFGAAGTGVRLERDTRSCSATVTATWPPSRGL